MKGLTYLYDLNFKWTVFQFFTSIWSHLTLHNKYQPTQPFFLHDLALYNDQVIFSYIISSWENNLYLQSRISWATVQKPQKWMYKAPLILRDLVTVD